MALKIWKSPIAHDSRVQTVPGRVINFDVQNGVFSVWCEVVEREADRMPRRIRVLPTGVDVPDWFKHFKTIQELGGTYVWHLYVENNDG